MSATLDALLAAQRARLEPQLRMIVESARAAQRAEDELEMLRMRREIAGLRSEVAELRATIAALTGNRRET